MSSLPVLPLSLLSLSLFSLSSLPPASARAWFALPCADLGLDFAWPDLGPDLPLPPSDVSSETSSSGAAAFFFVDLRGGAVVGSGALNSTIGAAGASASPESADSWLAGASAAALAFLREADFFGFSTGVSTAVPSATGSSAPGSGAFGSGSAVLAAFLVVFFAADLAVVLDAADLVAAVLRAGALAAFLAAFFTGCSGAGSGWAPGPGSAPGSGWATGSG